MMMMESSEGNYGLYEVAGVQEQIVDTAASLSEQRDQWTLERTEVGGLVVTHARVDHSRMLLVLFVDEVLLA